MSRHTSTSRQEVDRGVVMYTQCDRCLTVFRITARDLRAADGRVCCCFCNRAFQALDSLTDVLPSALLAEATAPKPAAWEVEPDPEELALPGADIDASAARVEPEVEADAAPSEDSGAVGIEPAESDLIVAFDVDEAIPESADWQVEAFYLDREAVDQRAGTHRRGTLLWSVGIGVLLAALLLQTAYAARAELARYPAVRPLLEQMCAVAGCELPPRRAVDRIQLVERQVSAHPDAAEALLVRAYIDNRAEFAQPYPMLGLTFFDRGGRRAGQRWFGPEEYLADPAAANGMMAPSEPVAVHLELMRPERGGDSYEFEFR